MFCLQSSSLCLAIVRICSPSHTTCIFLLRLRRLKPKHDTSMPPQQGKKDSLLFKFDNGHVNQVGLDNDSDANSEGTLLGDEFEEQFVRPTPEADLRPKRRIVTTQGNVMEIASFTSNNQTLRPGKTVELRDGDFLRITAISQHLLTEEIMLKWFCFRRNVALGGLLEYKRNEVTMQLKYDKDVPEIFLRKVSKSLSSRRLRCASLSRRVDHAQL
ncbi:hypothetical protein N7G274_008884 [Stereocaulon virgatum]|uniref:Uncharacterized protein n=1 Tax=Stereocaulon virgatum TaxID=373712 RepID=A0ABR3ZZJ9_9LECA